VITAGSVMNGAGSPGQHELVDVLGQRRAGRIGGDRIEAERDRDRDAPVRREPVGAAVLVDLPVHERRAAVDHLHPVHADVACAAARVARDHRGQREKRRRIAGPAPLHRQEREVDVVALQDDVVHRPAANGLRPRIRDRLQLLQAAHLVHQSRRRLHLEHVAQLARDVVELLAAESEAHAPLGLRDQRLDQLPQLVADQRLRHLRPILSSVADETAFAVNAEVPSFR